MEKKPKAKLKTKAAAVTAKAQVYNSPKNATIIINNFVTFAQKMEQRVSIIECQLKAMATYNTANAKLIEKLANDLAKCKKAVKPKELPEIRALLKL